MRCQLVVHVLRYDIWPGASIQSLLILIDLVNASSSQITMQLLTRVYCPSTTESVGRNFIPSDSK